MFFVRWQNRFMENILLATYFTAAAGAVVFFVLKARAAWRKVKVQDAIKRLEEAAR